MKDENAGHGGSYTVDKKTGQRTLAQRTAETGEPAAVPVKQKKQKPAEKEDLPHA